MYRAIIVIGVAVVTAAPASAQTYWYYCQASHGYYPYVKTCPAPWQEVIPSAGNYAARPATGPSARTNEPRPPQVSSESGQEILPKEISGVMDGPADNTCPSWQTTTEAKELVVYLTSGIKAYQDADRAMKSNSSSSWPAAATAALNQRLSQNRAHIRAVTACRDMIAEKIGMSGTAVKQLYAYNTLTEGEHRMFHHFEMQNYDGKPDFTPLIIMHDQHRALHLVDLELRDLDYSVRQFQTMVVADAGRPTEETDQQELANEIQFRKRLRALRTSIADKLENAESTPLQLKP